MGTLICQKDEADDLQFFLIETIPDNISPPVKKQIQLWIDMHQK